MTTEQMSAGKGLAMGFTKLGSYVEEGWPISEVSFPEAGTTYSTSPSRKYYKEAAAAIVSYTLAPFGVYQLLGDDSDGTDTAVRHPGLGMAGDQFGYEGFERLRDHIAKRINAENMQQRHRDGEGGLRFDGNVVVWEDPLSWVDYCYIICLAGAMLTNAASLVKIAGTTREYRSMTRAAMHQNWESRVATQVRRLVQYPVPNWIKMLATYGGSHKVTDSGLRIIPAIHANHMGGTGKGSTANNKDTFGGYFSGGKQGNGGNKELGFARTLPGPDVILPNASAEDDIYERTGNKNTLFISLFEMQLAGARELLDFIEPVLRSTTRVDQISNLKGTRLQRDAFKIAQVFQKYFSFTPMSEPTGEPIPGQAFFDGMKTGFQMVRVGSDVGVEKEDSAVADADRESICMYGPNIRGEMGEIEQVHIDVDTPFDPSGSTIEAQLYRAGLWLPHISVIRTGSDSEKWHNGYTTRGMTAKADYLSVTEYYEEDKKMWLLGGIIPTYATGYGRTGNNPAAARETEDVNTTNNHVAKYDQGPMGFVIPAGTITHDDDEVQAANPGMSMLPMWVLRYMTDDDDYWSDTDAGGNVSIPIVDLKFSDTASNLKVYGGDFDSVSPYETLSGWWMDGDRARIMAFSAVTTVRDSVGATDDVTVRNRLNSILRDTRPVRTRGPRDTYMFHGEVTMDAFFRTYITLVSGEFGIPLRF